LSRNCARATAGSIVLEDKARGLFIRLQDDADRALVPKLSDVADQARAAIRRDLGIELPRPLRIDLVRDLYSLAALSGLPLSAAETTGTVAVARWGRVNMISPRAASVAGSSYPWEDTLAHEITHLALSHATRDEAPLWLQEGLAKRQEIRWRPVRPFDGDPPADVVARDALLTGQSVGVDKLGPSIAMLPSADAASIAFAEVSSFVEYWVEQNGRSALRLLFADLKGLGSRNANPALESVSGYDLPGWIVKWQEALRKMPLGSTPNGAADDKAAPSPDQVYKDLTGEAAPHSQPVGARARARSVRIGELLFDRGAPAMASDRFRAALAGDPRDPSVRWRLGRSLIAEGREADAAPLFGAPKELDGGHPGWFGLAGRARKNQSDEAGAENLFELGIALDPYLEDSACEGHFTVPAADDGAGTAPNASLPVNPARRALCESARKIPRARD
jgi:hypothetical protein